MNNSIGLKQLNLAYNAPCSTGNEEAKKQVKTHSDIDLRHGRDTQRERILKDSSVRSIAQRERETDRQTGRDRERHRDSGRFNCTLGGLPQTQGCCCAALDHDEIL